MDKDGCSGNNLLFDILKYHKSYMNKLDHFLINEIRF